jgi:Flp pilus assembly secretin CpaC
MTLAAVLCFVAQPVPAQSPSNGGDIMPKTQVDKAADEPPIQGAQYPPLRLTLDKPGIVHLNKPAKNIVVPNEQNVVIRPDTRRTLIVQPLEPGATFFRALDKNGNIIMQRHIFVGAPKNNYVNIHRSCGSDSDSCQQESAYYCPGRCYSINTRQSGSSAGRGGGGSVNVPGQ